MLQPNVRSEPNLPRREAVLTALSPEQLSSKLRVFQGDFEARSCNHLHERLEFTPNPDPIVGILFFDGGNIEALTDVMKTVDLLYNAARHDLLAKRQALVRQIIEGEKNSKKPAG